MTGSQKIAHFEIHRDIRQARTLPSAVYHDATWFARARKTAFARAWHFVGDVFDLGAERERQDHGVAHPVTLLPGALDEPLLLTEDPGGTRRCLSNVCTHRGNLLVEGKVSCRTLRCRYHGRTFDLDGSFRHMPQFEGVSGFPSAEDDLANFPLARWGPLLFTALDPAMPFEAWIAPVVERTKGLPIEALIADRENAKTYDVNANWALYCDNYLEGFHIPYVHESLNEEIDYGAYRSELFEYANLQVGVASEETTCFDLPPDHPDADDRIAGYYFWLFPTTMLNFYPWGLSLNVVEPLGPSETRVRFLPYVWDASKRELGAGADLDRVEQEDEAIVEAVQRGVKSSRYDRGRYSPTMEQCVHHFHRLLAAALHNEWRNDP